MSKDLLESPADLNEPVDPNDRFAYGWRYVKSVLPDGSEKWEQVPLTLEDILHPQEEDFRVTSDPHVDDCHYLRGVFKAQLADTQGAYVLTDTRVAWDAEGEYGHGPDNAVVFNVRAYRRWTTFNVVEEGTKPTLIIEVTSPSTRSTDLVEKVQEYAEQGVLHYVIADARERKSGRKITLIDYHLNAACKAYELRPLNEDGRVFLPEVNLWLGVEDGLLVCYDLNGVRKGNYTEIEVERQKAVKQVERERKKAEKLAAQVELERQKAEARIRELEDKLKRRNVEPREGI